MAGFDVVQQTVDDMMQAKVRHDVVQVVDEIVALVDELEADDAAPALADTPDVAQDSAALADDPRNPWAEPATPPQPEPDPWLGPPTPETQAALDSWADAQAAYGSWPVLANLRQRQARQVRLAALLREAAELADDEGLGVTLLEHADTIPGLSDIELEYLRFADAARNWPVRPDSAGGGA
jgi:hypothetical protein